jgi:hypothetical protein
LAHSLSRVAHSELQYQIRLFLNGTPEADDSGDEAVRAFANFPTLQDNVTVQITELKRASKISCVNAAILDPLATGVVVLDDDILVPGEAFPEIDEFIAVQRQHFEALCFTKVPLPSSGLQTSFASQLSFLLHPSVQRILQETGFFRPYRPSGSLYAIHGNHMKPFPDPCNEADVLATRRVKMSCHFARTWYPTTFEEEVIRRTVHMKNTRSSGHLASAKSLESVAEYEMLATVSLHPRLPPHIRRRILDALQTMRSVMIAAEKEVIRAEHS